MKAPRVLIIENDDELAAEATAALERAGCNVVRAIDGLDGLNKLYEAYPDLIILDRDLPTVNGEEPYWRLKQAAYLPVVILGSDDEAADVLELGADAYMTKPPDFNELVAMVRMLLRRKPKDDPPGKNPEQEIKNHLDNGGDGSNGLTPTEFRLASCLILNEDRLLEYPRLISEVWGGKRVSVDTLHFHVRRLRSKLANVDILGLRGVGYCLSGDGGVTPQ